MKFIGITGGVGAGKSTILAYLRKNYRVRTLVADEVAHEIMEPGYDCYVRLQKEFAQEKIWLHNGRFNRQRLAEVIFADDEKRERLNSIVHPAVKEYILKEVERERRSGSTDYVVLEAALLIEDGYDKICDELWYVFVTEENRRKRLIENRGYSDEKIAQMFAAQLPEGEYRRHCQVIIDNNGPIAQVYLQLAQLLNDKGDRKMQRVLGQEEDTQKNEIQYVFGLDIGTRNVVGTVGYKKEKEFIVVAQYALEHETRAMLDGQIHDIGRVGRTISLIKEKLEDQIGQELTEVCIAAAGRVLKTVTTYVEYEFPEETVVTGEHIHTLELLGVDKAAQELKEANDTKYKFYCVGYSVMKYYINDEIFSNIESHKADVISAKIIVTFLPEDVVDGLYMAVGFAGLTVANMTLEPIAAIDVAIPENFRMLNIALVDVGAGTSDISLTRDGSIIAYGMIPFAGDELTEMIVQHYLVDFKMAEHIKLSAATENEIEFEDIMSLKHTITAEEVWKLTEPLVDKMSTDVADKIRELNGDQSVSATFIVGGGGKIHGFDEMLAKKLELPQERVALRGEEVLKEVTFLQEEIVKDPLLVTPIGICLNYYEQKNNFIMVRFNGERLKLYDNNKLTIVDAAIQAGFPNDQLFPKRGREINFTVNGRPRIVRGDAGEAAIIRMNDRPASINTPIEPNCEITIEPSTAGREAHYMVGQLEEYHSSTITFEVNGKLITCPRYVEVNGVLEPPTYEIKENDAIVTRSFYTVGQLAEFMDVELDMDADILVNNRVEDLQALVYENFSVDWKVISYRSTPQDVYPDAPPKRVPELGTKKTGKNTIGKPAIPALPQIQAGETAVKDIPSETALAAAGGNPGQPAAGNAAGESAGRLMTAAENARQEAVDTVHADVSGVRAADTMHGNVSGVAAADTVHENVPGVTAADTVHENVPGVTAADTVHENVPGVTAADTVHENVPGVTAADTVHGNISGMAAADTSGGVSVNVPASDRTADISAGTAKTYAALQASGPAVSDAPSSSADGYRNTSGSSGGEVRDTVPANAQGTSGPAAFSAGAQNVVPHDVSGARSAVPRDVPGAQSAVSRDVSGVQSAVSRDVAGAQSAVSHDVAGAQSAVPSGMSVQETASANTAGAKDAAVSGAAGVQAVSSDASKTQNAAASSAAGAQNAAASSAAGTQNAAVSSAAGAQNAAAFSASGTQNAAAFSASGTQNAAASNAAGTQNAAASNTAGVQNAAASNVAGIQSTASFDTAKTQNIVSSNTVQTQNAVSSEAAGSQGSRSAVQSEAVGSRSAVSSEAAGSQSAVPSDAAASADVFGKKFTDMVYEPAQNEAVKASGNGAGTNQSDQPFQVVINGETVTLKNKKEYIFVDIFEHITFDLSQSKGRMLKTEVNGTDAQYTQLLQPGDKISIYWKEG